VTAAFTEAAAIDQKATQKMGGCQSRIYPLYGSDHRFEPVYLHGGGKKSEPKGEIL